MRKCHLCFPVWNFAHRADPYMASILHIRQHCVGEPEREAELIQSVLDMAHAARYRAEAEPSALPPSPFSALREAVDRLAVRHG